MDLRRLRARIAGTSGLIRLRQVLLRSLSRVRTLPGRMPSRWWALTTRRMSLVFTLKGRWIRPIKGPPDLTSTTVSLRPRPISRCGISAMPSPLSQLGLLLIWIMLLPWASVLSIRSNPLASHYSHLVFLLTRITTIPMSVECRGHLPAWGKFTMEPTDRIPTPFLRLPLLLSQPGSPMIWTMFLPGPPVFFLTRSNLVAFHNSLRTFLSICIQP